MMFRVGLGQDSHSFVGAEGNKQLILGGVKVNKRGGLKASSDGDVILHSICNALSSAIGGDSLSEWADDMCLKQGIKDSKYYVEHIVSKIIKMGYDVVNVSISVEGDRPRLAMEIKNRIKAKIASLLRIRIDQVGLTFTSGEDLTKFGLGEGIQTLTIVSIAKND